MSQTEANPLLTYTPDPPIPEQESWDRHRANRDLWRRLITQNCDFVRLTASIAMDRAKARDYRIAMGGTLLELNNIYSVHGHGDFIKRAVKLLKCGKSTIYRYINLYRDTNGIPRPQRAAHLSQSGTNEGGGNVAEEPDSEAAKGIGNRGQICDVKLFFDKGTNQLREWQEAVTLVMLWNKPRIDSPSEVAMVSRA